MAEEKRVIDPEAYCQDSRPGPSQYPKASLEKLTPEYLKRQLAKARLEREKRKT